MKRAAIGICVLGTLACIPGSASATAITFTTCVSDQPCDLVEGMNLVLKLAGDEFEVLAVTENSGNWWLKGGIDFDSSLEHPAAGLVAELLASETFTTIGLGIPIHLILITTPQSPASHGLPWSSVDDFLRTCTRAGVTSCPPDHAAGGFHGGKSPVSGPDAPVPVPEPSTLLLTGLGLGLAAYRSRRRIRS